MAELEIKPSAASQMRVFVVVGLAAVIAGTLIFLLTGGGRNFFEPKTTLSTYMPDVTGLYTKADVRLSGIPIGLVTKIELSGRLDPQRVVRVEMRVSNRYLKNIPSDSETSLSADTLVGSEFVSIAEGKSPIPLAENGYLRSEPLKLADDRADLIRALQNELHQVDDILVQISSGQTPIGQFVMGEKEYDDILARISGLSTSLHSFVGPKSPTGQALFTNKLYDRIHTPVIKVDNMLASIQRGEGAAGKLFASDEQYTQFLTSLRNLRQMLADANNGKGQLGPLLQDPAAYRRVQDMLRQTDTLIASLNAGQLMHNPQLYENLNGSLRNLSAFLADFREHPKKYLRLKVF